MLCYSSSVPQTQSSSTRRQVAAPIRGIERRIYSIRGHRVMLDRELAELYGVKTIALRQQVKRNRNRFPKDFLFQLSKKEAETLVSQNVIPSRRSFGGSLPYAFTEQGVAMLSSVLTSSRAVQVNITIMRAFVKLREILSSHKELAAKIEELEQKYDEQFQAVFDAIYELMEPSVKVERRRIGFITEGGRN
jgi:phage regulator Rha-like protein